MDWTNDDDVSTWLIENGSDKYVNKFMEDEIDGLSLLNLSSMLIEKLLSTNTNDNILKKHKAVVRLNEKQSDILIQQLHPNQSTTSFLSLAAK